MKPTLIGASLYCLEKILGHSMSTSSGIGAMRIQDFCAWAGISRSTVYKEIKSGRLVFIKIGTRTLIRKADAEAWLDAHTPSNGQHS